MCLGVAAIRTVATSQFSQRKSRHLVCRVARRFIQFFVRTMVHSAMIPWLHLLICNTHDGWSKVKLRS
jgi:hypothetical protein